MQPGAVGYPMWNYAMAAMDGVWIFFGVRGENQIEFERFLLRIGECSD
jgi:hypothetical protein